jgi:RNA polymerase sigma factor (sigma-70 family)
MILMSDGTPPPKQLELSLTDEELVHECLNGNAAAWAALVDKYKNLIFSIPIRYGFRSEEADEIFQDMCVTLLVELNQLRNPHALPAWIIQATSRKCLHLKNLQNRFTPAETDNSTIPASSEELPESMLRQLEREQMVRNAIAELKPRCRELVDMLFFQEPAVPYAEVAQKLTIAQGSVGFIRMRCLDQLRRILGKKGFR